MSTKIRPVVSSKRSYYISKHRYYELKHFCLQYHEWQKAIFSRGQISLKSLEWHGKIQTEFLDPTANEAIFSEEARKNIDMVEKAAEECDPVLSSYILEAVTDGVSYTYLKMVEDMPCSRDRFYICYHRFFWILSQIKHASL